MSHLHDGILSTVGGTPVVRLRRLSPPGRTIWAKLESFNPLGSVKDRLALGVLGDAERRGVPAKPFRDTGVAECRLRRALG